MQERIVTSSKVSLGCPTSQGARMLQPFPPEWPRVWPGQEFGRYQAENGGFTTETVIFGQPLRL